MQLQIPERPFKYGSIRHIILPQPLTVRFNYVICGMLTWSGMCQFLDMILKAILQFAIFPAVVPWTILC